MLSITPRAPLFRAKTLLIGMFYLYVSLTGWTACQSKVLVKMKFVLFVQL